MDHLQKIFISEANDLLTDLERGLLALEVDPTDKEGIGKVFRSMHTLKGGASMFGFELISSLTHQLETIYESIRDGKGQLTSEILTVTFDSLDHLQKLLHDPQTKDKNLVLTQANLLEAIKELANIKTAAVTPEAIEEAVPDTYFISFEPAEGILRNGTNTLYFFGPHIWLMPLHILLTKA